MTERGLVVGEDGRTRCAWHGGLEDYRRYHDEEWGHPVTSDHRLFEKICLEGFQSGLSWLTILRKREGFRAAFAGFDFDRVAAFGEADIERCLADAGIVRHRGKIVSTVNNARRAQALRDEFDSLARLHATVDGLVIRGWTIRAPRPLFAAEDSLGVAMTVVPGITLSSLLVRTGRLDRKLFESLAPAVVEAMRVYWSAENRVYGDFHLRNVLCDPATRCLSLVDPGMPGPAWLCPDAPRLWFPASRDLAYLLYYTASAVKLTLGKPVLRRRERWLATRLLDVALNTLAAPEQRGALREEIRACAAAHAAQIRPARSLAGLWRSSVRRVTARYVARVLDSLGTASVEIPGAAHPLLPEEAHA